MSSETSVYFSPHLDDAVLSCSARILAERGEGRHVVVATLFSAGGDDEASSRLYEQRRQEDRTALALLDAEPVHLELLDAPYRVPFYRSFRTIVFGNHAEDEQHLRTLADAIRAVCQRWLPGRCYFPLGVGWHIDHRLTYRAAWEVAPSGEWYFYEDRPYALLRHAVRMRLAELGARLAVGSRAPDLQPGDEKGLVESLRHSLHELPFLRSYLQPGEEWRWCEAELIRRVTAPGASGGPCLCPIESTADTAVVERLALAVAAYTSQAGVLFGTREQFLDQYHTYAVRLGLPGAHAERLWKVEDEPGG